MSEEMPDYGAQSMFGSMLLNCVGFAIGIAIMAAILYFVSTWLSRIPAEYRRQEPNMVWLALIPIFNLFWMFMVFPKVAESYQAYFQAQGVTDVGDCGRQIALWMCICVVASIVPFLNCLAFPVSLVLLIMTMVKFSDLNKRVSAAAAY